ncbi:MAG: oxygen-independent coproporphyrinogen III oxidase [Methylophilaceae bacterium]
MRNITIKAPADTIEVTTLGISTEILQKYDVAGPRYTSYPTADQFIEAFTEDSYKLALTQRKMSGGNQPLSVYVHIPFCESLCFFCACNKIVTKHHERSAEYLIYLRRELALQIEHLGAGKTISQLHLGGGSPTFFSDAELTELIAMLKECFDFAEGGEYSIEVDPRTVNDERLAHLSTLGFNRLSFGVQDFDPEVQKAVHRIQPKSQVFSLVETARRLKFDSVNVDLIYGLPKQTPASFACTLSEIVSLKPDRVALYAYAHLPERFKPQRRIDTYALPKAADKITMLADALSVLLDAGYVYVGMDHFALPENDLAIAKRQGRLHRNFQGYSTQPDCDLISLGVSAIGRVGNTYSQNAKTLEAYYDTLTHDHLPIVRGLALTHDDLVRKAVIMAIMCQGELQYEAIELAYLIDFKTYFASELALLTEQEASGMVELDDEGLTVTEMGWFFVRAIAMVFDRYLQADRNRARFSKII